MENRSSRRHFLRASAGTLGAAFAARHVRLEAEPIPGRRPQASASDRVRFGMVGVGMQGSNLLATAITLPGVECAGAADLYDGRHTRAREIVAPDLRTTRRYQDLLDDQSIDCIVAAVPDHWHRRMVVDAVSAGKDIYCEKPMSHSVEDGRAMVAAAKKSGRIVQIGSQRTSSVLCAKARELVAKGVLGDVQLVEGSLGRNDPTGAWVYPPPPDLSPATLDWETWQGDVPRRAFDPKIFARWRCWKEYGTGVAGDLMVHLITGMMYSWGINEAPRRVMSTGGIRRFNDGRNMPDVHLSFFEYGEVPVYIRLNLGSETPEVLRFLGSKGILELSETGLTFSPQAGVDTSPSYYAWSFPEPLRSQYFAQWHAEHDPKPGEAPPVRESVSYRTDSYDDTRPHLWNFFRAVKTRQPVVQDAVFGHHAALACHMANESYFQRKTMLYDAAADTLKS
ncbi:MAG: Gfo/Idh/MocA family oxidoreductase [Acidobacteria bacterium]|nr:Gfo/Idh/MocA family oxidoreductase [Acidobacteriota bacterium]